MLIVSAAMLIAKAAYEESSDGVDNLVRQSAPCTVIAIVLDRKYKYGQHFIRYQLVTKFS